MHFSSTHSKLHCLSKPDFKYLEGRNLFLVKFHQTNSTLAADFPIFFLKDFNSCSWDVCGTGLNIFINESVPFFPFHVYLLLVSPLGCEDERMAWWFPVLYKARASIIISLSLFLRKWCFLLFSYYVALVSKLILWFNLHFPGVHTPSFVFYHLVKRHWREWESIMIGYFW